MAGGLVKPLRLSRSSDQETPLSQQIFGFQTAGTRRVAPQCSYIFASLAPL